MANTKKFNEFIEERYPQSGDYMVGYRTIDSEEFRIPLGYLNTSIISNRFIRKDIDDYADGVITFNSGLKTAGDVYSTIFLQGLNGWYIDPKGNLEVNSLTAREYIETPELRKNRITVMGNQFWFTDSALIRFVTATGSSMYDVYWKLEEGEYGSFVLDDIVKGIFHYDTGFYTTYLRVIEEILDDQGGQIGVKMLSINGRAPMAHMTVARMNNFTNKDRQGSIFVDGLKKYFQVTDGFNPADPTSEGSLDTLKVRIGDLSALKNTAFGNIDGYGLYAENVFLTGRIVIKNDPEAEGQELGVFRGLWDANTLYFPNDQVSYNGSLYNSDLINNIGHVPVGDSTDPWWTLVVSQGPTGGTGAAAAIIDLTNDNTTIPTNYEGLNPIIWDAEEGYIHKCSAFVYQGTTDISSLYDFKAFPSDNITIGVVSNANPYTIQIVGLTNTAEWDASSISVTATPKDAASGYATLTMVWSISLVRSGDPGEDATAYWIITDAPVIKKFKNGTFSPNPFISRARAKTGEDPIVNYNGYWRLSYGVTSTDSSGTVMQFTPLPTVYSYTIELYKDETYTVLLDKEIINVVEDGADGAPGINGDWQDLIFYRGINAPNTPTFTTPPISFPIAGWYDYPNADDIWWMSTATVDGKTNAIASWSKPIRMVGTDGENGSYYINVYKSSATQPTTPSGVTIPPADWSLTPTAPTDTMFTWMSQVQIYGTGAVGTWSTPIRISGQNGEDGADGTDIEFVYARTVLDTRPSRPNSEQVDDYVPAGWTDDPVGPDQYYPYEWTSVRYKVNGLWGDFSTPSLWSRWSFDGESGNSVEMRFAVNQSRVVAPSLTTTARAPAGWTIQAPTVNSGYHLWMTTATISPTNTLVGTWAAPVIASGETGGSGAAGADAYNPQLSSYAGVLLADPTSGTIIGSMATTVLTVMRGTTSLTYTTSTPGANQFSVDVSNSGLTYAASPTVGTTNITYNVSGFATTSTLTGSLTLTVNCENKSTFTRTYYVNRVKNGTDGASANTVEFRFQANTSSTSAPSLSNSTRYPSGWDINQPAISASQYLWMTSATILASNALSGTWSTPVRVSGVVGDTGATGQTGQPGAPGSNGSNGSDGTDARIASLSSYAGSFSWTYENAQAKTTPRNTLSTTVRAFRGTTALTPSTTSSYGYFSVSVASSAGVTASYAWSTGILTVTKLDPSYTTGTVTLTVGVDGAVTYSLIYTMVNVIDPLSSQMLGWITNWDGNSVEVNGNRVLAGRIFAGSLSSSGALTGVALGTNVINLGGATYSGLVAVKNNALTFKLDVDGSAWFGGTLAIGNTTFINPDGTGHVGIGLGVKNFYWESDGSVFMKNATISAGGALYLYQSGSNRYGYLDEHGMHLIWGGNTAITQSIDWYVGLGSYAGIISTTSAGFLSLQSNYGINIGTDAFSREVNIGTGWGSKVKIGNGGYETDFNNSFATNVLSMQMAQNWAASSLSMANWSLSTNYGIYVLNPTVNNVNIIRIDWLNGRPKEGQILILINESASNNLYLRGISYSANSNFSRAGGANYVLINGTSAFLVYRHPYWYVPVDWGQ